LKTQIITLESHDDLISVRDKLSWGKTQRILLVWPKYEKVTLRVLDLKVLQRHADSLGAQLGLVTRRAHVRRDAESLGIPVFNSTTTAQREPWPDTAPRSRRIPKPPRRDLRKIRDKVYEKESPWRTSLPGRVLSFTVGVIAVFAVAGVFVPRASLTLSPEERIQSVVIPVAASDSVQSVSLTGAVPAHDLSVIVGVEQSLAVNNEISVPKSKSKGIARFTNLSEGEVNIIAGTVVTTATEPQVKFITLHDTLLEPGIDKFVDIPIEAMQAGANGNVLSDQVVVVEGPLGLSISVTNPNPINGGLDSQMIGATEADRERLRNVVVENLRREAESKLRAEIDPDDVLLLDTLEAVQVEEENFDPPAGQPGKSLVLKMQMEYAARSVTGDSLKELSLSALNASVENGFESTAPPTYKVITEPSTDTSGTSHFELEVSRPLLRRLDMMQVFSIVRGNKAEFLKPELTSKLSLRKEPEITLMPSWWPWFPLIPINISVHIQ
jgi:hypothetical protein